MKRPRDTRGRRETSLSLADTIHQSTVLERQQRIAIPHPPKQRCGEAGSKLALQLPVLRVHTRGSETATPRVLGSTSSADSHRLFSPATTIILAPEPTSAVVSLGTRTSDPIPGALPDQRPPASGPSTQTVQGPSRTRLGIGYISWSELRALNPWRWCLHECLIANPHRSAHSKHERDSTAAAVAGAEHMRLAGRYRGPGCIPRRHRTAVQIWDAAAAAAAAEEEDAERDHRGGDVGPAERDEL